jgi:hypothetical protein
MRPPSAGKTPGFHHFLAGLVVFLQSIHRLNSHFACQTADHWGALLLCGSEMTADPH